MDLSSRRTAYLETAYDLLHRDLLPQAPARSAVALAWSFPSRGARSNGRSVRLGECHFAKVEQIPTQ